MNKTAMKDISEWTAHGYARGWSGMESLPHAVSGEEDIFFDLRWQRLQTVTLFVAIMALCVAVWMARGKWDQAERDRREAIRIESLTRL